MSVWEICKNRMLTQSQIDFIIEKLNGTLLFVSKDDEWFPIGEINDENEKQAECIMNALNKMDQSNG